MLDCLIIGDSIAKGISMQMPFCHSKTQVGISSQSWRYTYSINNSYDITIISLGVNDSKTIDTHYQLTEIRKKIKTKKVFWILPNIKFNEVRAVIETIANEFNDTLIEIPLMHFSKDQVHPTANGYKNLAEIFKK